MIYLLVTFVTFRAKHFFRPEKTGSISDEAPWHIHPEKSLTTTATVT
jgi:hypothetical protein